MEKVRWPAARRLTKAPLKSQSDVMRMNRDAGGASRLLAHIAKIRLRSLTSFLWPAARRIHRVTRGREIGMAVEREKARTQWKRGYRKWACLGLLFCPPPPTKEAR